MNGIAKIKSISFLCRKTKVIQMVYSVSIGLSYALQCYVAVEIIWGNHLSKSNLFSKYPTLGEYAVRLAIVLLTCEWNGQFYFYVALAQPPDLRDNNWYFLFLAFYQFHWRFLYRK